LKPCHATVIGLDGIGRQTALHLASLILPWLQLIDHRPVTRTRQISDGYAAEDIGRPKVHATAQACHAVNPQLDIQVRSGRSCLGLDFGDVVFCSGPPGPAWRCLWAGEWQALQFFAWSRPVGSVVQVDVTGDPNVALALLDQQRSCGRSARSRPSNVPIHLASIATGMAVAEFMKFTHGNCRRRNIRLDLDSMKLAAEESA